ncbi:MAG: YjbQ family protein [Candidatus Brocadiae bacterium]|nr:YjbQ family protein [Candidatus Brocadiia bacterium]
MQELAVPTRSRVQLVDITSHVQAAVAQEGITDGVCHVAVPHTTAGVTLNENADPDVTADIIAVLDGLVPRRDDYRHVEGNSDSHVKASLMGFTATIPVAGGRLVLGTWQAVYFCEFDGPRRRRCLVTAVGK